MWLDGNINNISQFFDIYNHKNLNIHNDQKLNVVEGDVLNIQYNPNNFDYTMCIAVLHHLSTECKRKQAINELIRITKPGCKILILVWALEQELDSKRKFDKQDN